MYLKVSSLSGPPAMGCFSSVASSWEDEAPGQFRFAKACRGRVQSVRWQDRFEKGTTKKVSWQSSTGQILDTAAAALDSVFPKALI